MNLNYWIGVVSGSHIRIGVEGGFVQLNHGKKAPLQGFHAGDGLVIYSPRTSYPDGEPLQAFTAIGVVTTGDIYQVQMSPGFEPYRVDVQFMECREAPIKPLIDELSFITNKSHWGAAFRSGQDPGGGLRADRRRHGLRPVDQRGRLNGLAAGNRPGWDRKKRC